MIKPDKLLPLLVLLLTPTWSASVLATEGGHSAEDLAKAVANPVAALISLPLQFNYDRKVGPANDGERSTLNVQPVVPFDLSSDWNLISRTILPIISQDDIYPGAGSQSGTGDVVQSLFFSPKAPTDSGWIWGVGPVLLLPTGSDDLLTADKWGAGPTGVALKQDGAFTYGALANHIWSLAGDDDRADVSSTFLQPFFTYTTPSAWSFTLQTESTYDWKSEQWSIPVHAMVAKVTRFGGQMVSLAGGVGYWVDSPDSGPEGWRVRLQMILLFPR